MPRKARKQKSAPIDGGGKAIAVLGAGLTACALVLGAVLYALTTRSEVRQTANALPRPAVVDAAVRRDGSTVER